MEGNRGQEPGSNRGGGGGVYGRQEKKVQEMGYPRGWELGEIENKFCNIVQFFTIEKAHRGGNH